MFFTKESKHPVKTFASTEDIASALSYGKTWRSDPLKGLFDYVYHPTSVQKHIDNNTSVGDCDDHAIYWCAALLKSGLAEKVWISFYQMEKPNKKIGGHVVCVYRDHDGNYFWADYKKPKQITHIHQWYIQSARQRRATPLYAAMTEVKTLKPNDTLVLGSTKRLLVAKEK
jgi:hypothetical protein